MLPVHLSKYDSEESVLWINRCNIQQICIFTVFFSLLVPTIFSIIAQKKNLLTILSLSVFEYPGIPIHVSLLLKIFLPFFFQELLIKGEKSANIKLTTSLLAPLPPVFIVFIYMHIYFICVLFGAKTSCGVVGM